MLSLLNGLVNILPSCLPFVPEVVTCLPFSTRAVWPRNNNTSFSADTHSNTGGSTYCIEEVDSDLTQQKVASDNIDDHVCFAKDERYRGDEC